MPGWGSDGSFSSWPLLHPTATRVPSLPPTQGMGTEQLLWELHRPCTGGQTDPRVQSSPRAPHSPAPGVGLAPHSHLPLPGT